MLFRDWTEEDTLHDLIAASSALVETSARLLALLTFTMASQLGECLFLDHLQIFASHAFRPKLSSKSL